MTLYRKGDKVKLTHIEPGLEHAATAYWEPFIGQVGVIETDQEDPDDYIEVRFTDDDVFPALELELEKIT